MKYVPRETRNALKGLGMPVICHISIPDKLTSKTSAVYQEGILKSMGMEK